MLRRPGPLPSLSAWPLPREERTGRAFASCQHGMLQIRPFPSQQWTPSRTSLATYLPVLIQSCFRLELHSLGDVYASFS